MCSVTNWEVSLKNVKCLRLIHTLFELKYSKVCHPIHLMSLITICFIFVLTMFASETSINMIRHVMVQRSTRERGTIDVLD